MPRTARIDPAGALQHLITRGVNRCEIFMDDEDRRAFLTRAIPIFEDCRVQVLAWCLMGNHVHVYARGGPAGVALPMQRLLTSYAIYFNRRHGRTGHLFENRYKNVLVDCTHHHLELLRYIPLNPVRAGIVEGLDELMAYRWTSLGEIVGKRPVRLVDVEAALASFERSAHGARRCYVRWLERALARGVDLSPRIEAYEARAARERDAQNSDAVALDPKPISIAPVTPDPPIDLEQLTEIVCAAMHVEVRDLLGGRRDPSTARARAVVAHLGVVQIGLRGAWIARFLGISASATARAATRGRELCEEAGGMAHAASLSELRAGLARIAG